MKKNNPNRWADFWLTLQPVLQTGGIVGLFVICFLIPFFIAYRAPQLKIMWIVLVGIYFAFLISIYWIVISRRRDLDLRGIMGDETFYAAYPRAKYWDDFFAKIRKFFVR